MYHDIRQLGEGITHPTHMETNAGKFIGSLHAKNGLMDVGDRNLLRYKLFIRPGKKKSLLTTYDGFHQHFLRVTYTAYIKYGHEPW